MVSEPNRTYTYRGGERISLAKSSDSFIVNAPREFFGDIDFPNCQELAPTLQRVTTLPAKLDAAMTSLRTTASVHPAYYLCETGQEFLISDRVFVKFVPDATDHEIEGFIERYGLQMQEKFIDNQVLLCPTDRTGTNPVELVRRLIEQENVVETADHDLIHIMQKSSVPLAPGTLFPEGKREPRASSRCSEGWRLLGGPGERNIVIGMIDDGCRLDHPALSGLLAK